MQGFKPGAKPKDKGKGGKIQGPGTGTSDSIRTEVPSGSYIMPADSTAKIGEKALDEIGKQVPVNVSSGEYHMPPEQVHAVGAQVLDQMKAATHTPVAAQGFKPQEGELYFADGGKVESTDELIARISAKYGTGAGSAPREDPKPAPNPQQPAQRPAAPSIGSAVDAIRNRKRQIDEAAGFADGGLVDEERRRLPASPLAMSYGDMTGRPGARPAPQPQQGAAAMPSVSYGDMQRAPSIPQPSTPAPARRIDSAPAPQPSAQGAPRAEQAPQQPAQQEATPTQEPQPSPTTFSSLQREPNIPRSGQPHEMPQGEPIRAGDIAQGFRSAGDAVADGVGRAARDFRAGGEAATGQIAGFAGRVADALSPDRSANYDPAALGQPEPNPNAGSVWGAVKDALLYSSDAEAIRQRNAASKAAPTTQSAPGAVASTDPALGGASPKAETTAVSPRPQYGFTPEPMQGPAPSMSVSRTSAPGINRIDNALGLKSPLFTNLPTGEAVSGVQGGTVSTVPAFKAPAATQQAPQPAGFQLPRQQSPAGGVIGNSDPSRRERDALIRAASTPYRGAQNGQLTANQLRTLAGLQEGDQRAATEAANQQAATERAAMQEAGANSRALSRDEIDRRRAASEELLRGFEARGMERAEKLYAAYENARTPEERAAVAEQLRALSGKEAPNRFTVVPGGQEIDPTTNMAVTRPARVFNNQSGQFVDQQGAPGASAAPRAGEVRGGYRFKGGNPADQASWEKV